MKRDNDYMIDLLKDFEKSDMDIVPYPRTFESDPKLHHHLKLLCDEEFIEKIGKHGFRITKWGHDFLDNIDKGRLENIKDTLKEEYGSTPLEIISSLGLKIIKSKLGL